MDVVSVVCVLKEGGAFNAEHALTLKEQVGKNLSVPYQFICLSDRNIQDEKPLLNNYPKWWSKIEAFRITGAVIYLDLDTSVFNSINSLAESIVSEKQQNISCLYMLRTFQKTEKWSSTVMAWSGNWRWLYDEFAAGTDMTKYGYDQRYLIAKMEEKNKPIIAVQSLIRGTVWCSKHHTPTEEEIKRRNITICCFHNRAKK